MRCSKNVRLCVCGRAIVCVCERERFKYSRILLIGHKYHTCNFTEYGYDNLYMYQLIITIGESYRKNVDFSFECCFLRVHTYMQASSNELKFKRPYDQLYDQNWFIVPRLFSGIFDHTNTTMWVICYFCSLSIGHELSFLRREVH